MSSEEAVLTVLLILAGVAAGFINTLAGGGSMLTLPLLMMLGLPADIANGTNRVAVVAQGISGAWGFHRRDRLDIRNLGTLAAPPIMGALLGAYLATELPRSWLRPTLLGTLFVVALVMLIRPGFLRSEGQASPEAFGGKAWLGLFAAGVYGGFVQAGVGFLLLSVLCGSLRYDFVRGNALKIAIVLLFSLVSLAVFSLAGQVRWSMGFLLAGATVVGSQIGVRTALRIRPESFRWILFAAVSLSCLGAMLTAGPNH